MLPVKCDITSTEDVERAFAEIEAAHGPVEVLVANAGITRDTLVLRMTEEDFTAVLDTNLTGAFRVAKRGAKSMLRQRKGRIIFISSVVGLLGSPGQVNYAASKAGLVGMARSMARELGSRSITTNVIAPGFIETAMTAELTEDRQKQILDAVPLRPLRAGPRRSPASSSSWPPREAAYITGAVVPVDGGLGMGH